MFPDYVLTAIDMRAKKMGLSRAAYIRRKLTQDAESAHVAVTTQDFERFRDAARDLSDDKMMREAWL